MKQNRLWARILSGLIMLTMILPVGQLPMTVYATETVAAGSVVKGGHDVMSDHALAAGSSVAPEDFVVTSSESRTSKETKAEDALATTARPASGTSKLEEGATGTAEAEASVDTKGASEDRHGSNGEDEAPEAAVSSSDADPANTADSVLSSRNERGSVAETLNSTTGDDVSTTSGTTAGSAASTDALNEEKPTSGATRGDRSSTSFRYEEVSGGLKIVGWDGTFDDPATSTLIIPNENEGKAVVEIGPNVFQRKLIKKLTIGANVKTIGSYAFADNKITEITFAKPSPSGDNALVTIGDHAFSDNFMTSLVLPPNVETIGSNAFSNATLRNVSMGNKVKTIGSSAFEKNDITAATLPASVTSFGSRVFVDNHRFVAVTTSSTHVPKIEKLKDGQGRLIYGHVIDPISVVIQCVDEKTGEVLLTQTEGTDLTKENVFVKNETINYTTPEISGYYAPETVDLTPTAEGETLTIKYKSTSEPPVIELVASPTMELGLSADEVEQKLKSFVKATDLTGADITVDIQVDQGSLDPNTPGTYPVIYRVTDRFGNTSERSVDVGVANDWEAYPIGGGWVMGDFTYSGSTLTGFSQAGLEKYNTNKDIVLPGFVLTGSSGKMQPGGPLKTIGNSAFKDKRLNSVDFSLCENLEVIDSYAFRSTRLPSIDFNQLPKLRRIESLAFNETALNDLDFSPAKNLEYIGSDCFSSIYGGLTSLNFGSLPKLKTINGYAFSTYSGGNQIKFTEKLDLTGLTALEYLGAYNFKDSPISEIDVTGLTKLKTIGTEAFQSPTGANSGKGRPLIGLSTLTGLESIGNNAFAYNYLPEIDLSGMNSLVTINYGAFRAYNDSTQTTITWPESSKLQTIGSYAFQNRKMEGLTIEHQPMLSSIGSYAFNGTGISELTLNDLPALNSVGDYAFANNKLTETDWTDLPALKTVTYKAFINNLGKEEYSNKVVVHYEPRAQTVIPSTSTFIVNPVDPVDEDYAPEDFRYGMENGEWSILGFTDSGLNKLLNGRRTIVFPATSPDGREVTGLGRESFAGMDFDKADLSNLSKLKRIGDEAFDGATVKEFDFSKLPELTTIGTSAFRKTGLTSVDFSGNPALANIESSAFYNSKVSSVNFENNTALTTLKSNIFASTPLKQLHFKNLPNVTTIESYAFGANSTLEHDLDLTGMPGLQKINNYAFERLKMDSVDMSGLTQLTYLSGFNNTGLKSIDLTQVPNVTTIGYQAFYYTSLGSVDLSPLTELTTISGYAFKYAELGQVNFGSLSKLKTIEYDAFASNKLKNVDMSGLSALNSLGSSAFAYNQLTDVSLPMDAPLSSLPSYVFRDNPLQVLELSSSITSVSDYAFYKYNYSNMKTALLTPDHNGNGGRVKASPSSISGGHIVDAKYAKVYYKRGDTDEDLRPPYVEINTDDSTVDFYPVIIPGLVPREGKTSVDFSGDEYAHEIVFHYDPINYEVDPNDKITMSHVNAGSDTGIVGSSIVTRYSMDCTKMTAPVLEPVHAIISFDPAYVDKVVVAASPFYESSVDMENGLIDLTFPSGLTAGTKLTTDIGWKFKVGPTPMNYAMEIPTDLRRQDGRLITFAKDAEGKASFPTIHSIYEEPSAFKGFIDDFDKIKYGDGQVQTGGAKKAVLNGEHIQYADPENLHDVVYLFEVGQSLNDSKLQRDISQITLVDHLPTYKAYVDGQAVTKYASFDPAKNPGWVLDEDAHTVTFTKEYPTGSSKASGLPRLVLTYPEAVIYEPATNRVDVTMVPHKAAAEEPTMTASDDVEVTLAPSKIPPPPPPECYSTKDVDRQFFRDYPTDKNRPFVWTLGFGMGTNEVDQEKTFDHLVFHDMLDPRMMYTELELPTYMGPATITGVSAGGATVELATGVTGNYVLEQPNDLVEITIDFGDHMFSSNVYVNVTSVLRDPTITYNKEDKSKNAFMNRMDGSVKRYLSNGELDANVTFREDYATSTMLPLELTIGPTKTSTYYGEMNSAGTPGSFTLGVTRQLADDKNSPSDYDIDIPDFRMIDVLPEGVMLVGEPQMSPEFAACPGARVTTHFGYGNIKERVVIVYEADILKTNVTTVGTINTELDMLIAGGLHTNTVYMTFDKDNTVYKGASAGKVVPEFGDGVAYMDAKTNFSVLEVNFINVAKYIRTAEERGGQLVGTSQWTNSGMEVPLGSKFQYMLRIDNRSEAVTKNNEIFDVLPYEGDKTMQTGPGGTRQARGSRFGNTFLGARIVSEALAGDYTLMYTSDPINYPDGMEAGAYMKTLSWSTTKPAAPTAIRVKPKNENVTIEPGQSLMVQLDMQAPPDNEVYRAMGGASAYNSFVRHSNETGDAYVETNRVYDRIPYPKGSLTLQKKSRVNDPATGQTKFIEGAEFSLINSSGAIVATAVTGPDGRAQFNDVVIDDYTLRETVVPEGYHPPQTDAFVKAQDWMRKIDQGYHYDIGLLTNEPIFDGRVYLEKVDATGAPLSGVEFTLEKIGDRDFAPQKLRTDNTGRVEYTGLGEGTYKLTESRTLNNLVPNGVIKVNGQDTFQITYPDQVYSLTVDQNAQIVNDKVDVRLFKLGLNGPLDKTRSLGDYSLLDGRTLNERVGIDLREKDGSSSLPYQEVGDHWVFHGLSTNKVYTLTETSVPQGSIYRKNPVSYDFMVDLKGRLLTPDNKPFKSKDIYLPNEKKPLVGRLVVNKKDAGGAALAGATFTLNCLNEATGNYEPATYDAENDIYKARTSSSDPPASLTTGQDGQIVFPRIAPGSYQLKETGVPEGHVGQRRKVRFLVADAVNEKMMSDPSFDASGEEVVQTVTIDAVNYPIDMDFIKIEPLANNVSEAEADALVSSTSGAVKEANGNFFNVYRKVSGATFKVVEVNGGTETVLKEGLVTNAEGRLDLSGITWNAFKVYRFIETATSGSTWADPGAPYEVNIANFMALPNFDGHIKIRFENHPKRGSIILSKYERFNNQRLEGAEFKLYHCSLADYQSDPTSQTAIMTGSTDNNGFIKFDDLDLGTYVLKESKVPNASYRLIETPIEVTITAEESTQYVSLYNLRNEDLFDLPAKVEWLGDPPATGTEVTLKLYRKDVSGVLGDLAPYEDVETVTVTVGEDWTHVFADLYVAPPGHPDKPYLYKVEQLPVEGYRTETSSFEVKKANGKLVYKDGTEVPTADLGSAGNKQALIFKNYKKMDILVKKTWVDDTDPTARPETIQVKLFKNGTEVEGSVATLSETNGVWEHIYSGVDKTDSTGTAITYSVQEIAVPRYYTTYSSAPGGTTSMDDPVDLTLGITNTVYPQVGLKAHKTLEHKPLEAGLFNFQLYRSDATGALGDLVPGSVTNAADGSVSFPSVDRPTALGADHAVYYVMEEQQTAAYFSRDERLFLAKVYMTAPAASGTTAVPVVEYYPLEKQGSGYVVGGQMQEAPVYTNTYLASGEWTPEAVKSLTGRDLKMDEFGFRVKQISGRNSDQDGQVILTAKNGRVGQNGDADDPTLVDFDALTYDQTDIGKTYTYEISEDAPTETGMSGDQTIYTATVEVTDLGSGQLDAAVSYTGQDGQSVDQPLFNNTYKATGAAVPGATTTLTGRPLKNDDFSFALKQVSGKDASKNGKILQTSPNGQNSSGTQTSPEVVSFADLTYDETDIGKTYTYEMSEVRPGQPENGMTYDDNVYTMTVTVADKGNGELDVKVSYSKNGQPIEGQPVFNNVYVASGSWTPEATKKLTGRELSMNEFSFELKQVSGPDASKNDTVLQTVKNGRAAVGSDPEVKGAVDFAAISYDQTSINKTYTYQLTEVAPTENGMAGDGKTYTATVVVTDATNGALDIAVTWNDGTADLSGTPVLENTYTATGSVLPKAETDLTGRTLKPDEFSFKLKQVKGPDPDKDGSNLEEKKNGRPESGGEPAVDKAIDFTGLSYDQTSIGKTYTYEITEEAPTEGGMTGDSSIYTMTVTVSDKGGGELGFEVVYKKDGVVIQGVPVFHNRYEATGTAAPAAKKVLNGRELSMNEFSFELKQISGPDPAKNNTVLETVKNGRAAQDPDLADPALIDFTALTYDQTSIDKSYTYEIREVKPAQPENGMTYDDSVITVTIAVTDATNGVLDTAVSYSKKGEAVVAPPVFTNSYKASGSTTLHAAKTVDGRSLKMEEFSFELKQIRGPDPAKDDTVLQTVKNGRKGQAGQQDVPGVIDFTDLSYDQSSINKTYTYQLTEVAPTENGMAGDSKTYTATVAVTDATNGVLDIAVTWNDGTADISGAPVFENTYTATGSFLPKAETDLTGRELTKGEFSFKLKQVKGPDPDKDGSFIQTRTNGRDASGSEPEVKGAVDFGGLSYDQTSIGKTYTYEISEETPTEGGMTGDSTVYTMTVTVSDKGNGELGFEVVYKKGDTVLSGPPVFHNIYRASGSTPITAKKTLNGRHIKAGEFSFQLKQIYGPDAAKNDTVLETVTNGRAAQDPDPADPTLIDFTALAYDQTSINKTYIYELSEVAPTENGMEGDSTVYTISVAVTDATNGKLNVVATYNKGQTVVAAPAAFTNDYSATGTWSAFATKELDGRELSMNEFSFQLKQITGPDRSKDGTVIQTAKNGRAGTGGGDDVPAAIDFPQVGFDQDALYKTFTYELSEVEPQADDAEKGMTYNGTVYTATVQAHDEGEGQLRIDVVWTDPAGKNVEHPAFKNTYRASGELSPEASVVLTGRELTKGEFSFNWKQVKGPDASQDGQVTDTKPNGRDGEGGEPPVDGAIDFNKLSYTQYDIGKTYTYEVTQVPPTENGMTGDPTVHTATVKITDAGNGKLNVVVTYNDGKQDITGDPVFRPRYEAKGDWTPAVKKALDGRALKADEFTFQVKQITGPDRSKDGKILETQENALDGSIQFAKIGYDQTSINKTYTYEVSEVKPADEETGMTYSGAVYTATVKVTDAREGLLDVDVSWTNTDDEAVEATDLVFDNTYRASGELSPEASVVLTGRKLTKGEFSFNWKQVKGPDASKDGEVIETKPNGRDGEGGEPPVDGAIDFSKLSYDQYDIGKTYTYEVSMVPPTENKMTGDPTVYTATVTIVDEGNGKLGVKVVYSHDGETLDSDPVFQVIYEAEGGFTPVVKKVLTGRVIKADEFSFVLKQIEGPDADKDGTALETVTNEADGQVPFGRITYDEDSIDKTYRYEISEQAPVDPENGMTYDPTVYTATVTVTDAGEGKLDVKVDWTGGDLGNKPDVDDSGTGDQLGNEPGNEPCGEPQVTELTFHNDYKATGSWTPVFKKILNGRVLKAGEFTFGLKLTNVEETSTDRPDDAEPGNEPGSDPSNEQSWTATNEADGSIRFKAIGYDQGSIGKTYVYELREIKPETPEEGMDYDQAVYTITVKVTDAGQGRLNTDISYQKSDVSMDVEPEIINTYKASGSARVLAKKVLEGRGLKGDEFRFELAPQDGAPGSVQQKSNAADGAVVFDPLTYTEADIDKTYVYELKEVVPSAPATGMTYDRTVYRLTVKVTDAGNGSLAVAMSWSDGSRSWTAEGENGAPVFTNRYKAPPVPLKQTNVPQASVPRTGESATEAVVGAILLLLALMAGLVTTRRRREEEEA